MALSIRTNIASLEALRNVNQNQTALTRSFNRLSSGYRINSAADDAAGLAISETLKSQIRSFVVAERNAADGISMAQTAESALGEVHAILGRMRELAMQASNGSMSANDRTYLNDEFALLQAEITRSQASTQFSGVSLIQTATASTTFQVGLNDTASDQITVTFGGVDLSTLLAGTTLLTGATTANALAALGTIDAAINTVSASRAQFGAAMNRMETATANIQTMRLNTAAAESRIRDVDVAAETAAMTKNQVLTQAAISVLAQANSLPQLAFGLLQS